MKYQVYFTNEAKIDLIDAVKWYKSVKLELGKNFLSSVRHKVKILNRQPEIFQIKYNQVRTLKIGKFPYLLHYKIDNIHQQVIILAILHTASDTAKFKNK
jgi:toxin ParE1/3/4